MAEREMNHCRGCRYTWFPRGHPKSASCPQCKFPDVETATERANRHATEQKRLTRATRDEAKAIVRTRDPEERMECPFCGVSVTAQNFITHRDKCVVARLYG